MDISVSVEHQGLILIVDDQPESLQILFHYLKEAKYKVLVAQSGKIAMNTTKLLCPDLILLDIKMKGLNGFDTCRYFKSNAATENIPIIFMTGLTDNSSKVQGFEVGGIDYVTKPINQEELLARIETHIQLSRFNKNLQLQAAEEKILFQLSEQIRQSLNIESTLQTAVTEIRQLFDYDRVIINRLDNKNTTFVIQSCKEQINQVPPGYYSYYFSDLCLANSTQYDHYQQGNIRVVGDTTKLKLEPKEIENLQHLEVKAELIIPILLNKNVEKLNTEFSPIEPPPGDSLWGWLIIHQCESPKEWQQREINLLKRLASQLAVAINQGLLYHKLQKSNQKLQKLALCDPLTQVYNRRYFEQQIEQEWKRLKRIPSPLSIILCDVDHFKLYNDTYGHQQGDKCLKKVAEAISNAIRRPADFVARYGGEEFVIVLPHTPAKGAVTVAKLIQDKIQKLHIPHPYSLTSSIVTVSMGIAATIPVKENSSNLLVEAADQALYLAKSQGRNQFITYNKDISESRSQQQQELQWGKRLRNALENNLFCLYAQEITSLKTSDNKKHLEILLRLQDEDNNIISPGVFLDIAHRCCLMPQIDGWVIDNLFARIAQLGEKTWQNYIFTINLSGDSLNQPSFIDFLKQKIIEYNLSPNILCFEITESIAINNINHVSKFIQDLKKIGCTFALDDFGKGMSSLTYLKNLPVDYLKIDGSFILDINTDSVTKAMVITINKLAQVMGLKTIAEFVETKKILTTIKQIKIDYAQGFYLSKPIPLNTIFR